MRQMTLDEIPLNPSVKAEDEKRLSHQAREILSLFRYKLRLDLPVSTIELIGICGQYQARLWEVRRFLLKHCNQCIDRIRGEKGCYYYKIMPKELSTFYAERKAKLDLELGL